MFISFEGPDGSGKTTIINRLEVFFAKENIAFVSTREPGSKHFNWGFDLRSLILDANSQLSPMVEALLYTLDRRLHLEKVIWPALKAQKIVICDRYLDSTLAYQGFGRNLGWEKMYELQQLVTETTLPDLTFFFDLHPLDARNRVQNRGFKDRIELAGEEFDLKVYNGYKQLTKLFPQRFVVLDAKQSVEEIFRIVTCKINEVMKHSK